MQIYKDQYNYKILLIDETYLMDFTGNIYQHKNYEIKPVMDLGLVNLISNSVYDYEEQLKIREIAA